MGLQATEGHSCLPPGTLPLAILKAMLPTLGVT